MDKAAVTPFSPSQTEDWLRCPRFMQYRREGWEPRVLNWKPNMLLGSAIAKGLETFYNNLHDSDPANLAWAECERVVVEGYRDNEKWTVEGVTRLARKGLSAALDNNIAETETVVAAELPIGPCRPDLITRSKTDGGLIVTDTKVTLELDERYRAKRLSEYDSSFQFWQYAEVVSAYYGEPVRYVRVQLVVLSPRCVALLYPIQVTEGRLRLWREGAEWAWPEMAAQQEAGYYPPRFTECHGKFGKCAYYEACHQFQGDRRAMDALYEKMERLGPDSSI